MKKILHTWDLDNAQNSASEIESLKLLSRDYRGMNVSNLTSDIVIKIKNRPEKLNMSRIKLNFPQEMSIRKERIKSYDSPLLVEFSSPDNSSSNFTVLIQFGYPPTKENYDAKLVITPAGIQVSKSAANISANVSLSSNNTRGNSSEGDRPLVRNSHIRVIDSKTIILWDFQNFTYAYLGNKDMFFNFFYTGDMPAPVLIPNEYTFDILEIRRSRNYTMRTFSCSCLYWSTEMDKWTDDGCKVSRNCRTDGRIIESSISITGNKRLEQFLSQESKGTDSTGVMPKHVYCTGNSISQSSIPRPLLDSSSYIPTVLLLG